MRTPQINAALERSLTRERLAKYLVAQGNDLNSAIALYERNMRLSEAMYSSLQCLEVCLRNTVDQQMVAVYGQDWLTNHTAAPLTDFSRRLVREALEEVEPRDPRGKLVAELKFAFWVGLHGPGYDNTIWRGALTRGFRARGGKKRSDVHGRLNAIRRLRNRIAHHEPIYHLPMIERHTEVLEAIGWMCRDTEAWATHTSRFVQVFNAN